MTSASFALEFEEEETQADESFTSAASRFKSRGPVLRIPASRVEIPCAVPWVDKKGQARHTIRVTKGDSIAIPIAALNRSKVMWGDDALEFKCAGALGKVAETATHITGIWGHQLSFLAGLRACVGYRFSLAEIKALLYVLLRAFELELAVPPADLVSRATAVQRPYVRT
ncbi:hypothetical protein HWV62_6753 [Athelia sp. TMB]|nr:hypothetical protein HWV62_6753 [Athelia sp. TMB]